MGPRPGAHEAPQDTSRTRATVARLAALVVLAAFAARVWALDVAPPGLHFDEAVYGLLARDIQAGARPVFFPAYTGREPLYMYVMAGLFALVGDASWVLRFTSVVVGTATVALAFALGRALYGRTVGLVAAALLAVQYWHLTVSRNGYPNILIPPLEALSALFLWRAWRGPGRRWGDWALGGAFAGLVLYTYLAARFWPVFLVVFLLYAVIVDRRKAVLSAPGIVVAAAAAGLVFAPLGLHFARHPEDFLERANQVLAWRQLSGSDLLATYASNAWLTLRGFVAGGDPRWHFNLPGRAVFQPWLAVALVVGLAVCLRRWRDVRYALPVLWVLVMILPGVLTLELQPAGQRVFGVFPAIVFVPAIGLAWAAGWLARRSDRRRPVLLVGLVGLVLAVDVPITLRDYFVRWSRSPETAHIFNADYVALSERAAVDLEAGRDVVLLTEHHKHATVAFLVPEAVDRAVWADPALALPLPAPRRGGRADDVVAYRLTASLPDGAPATDFLQAHASSEKHTGLAPTFRDGEREVSLGLVRYVLPRDSIPPLDAHYRLGGEIEAAAAARPIPVDRNEPLVLPVTWSVVAVPDGPRSLALHLRDAAGVAWAQADQTGFLAEQWRSGDRVLQWFTLALDRAMPPGDYSASLVLVDGEGRALPVTAPDGEIAPDAEVAHVRVRPEGRVRASAEVVPSHVFEGGLALIGGMTAEPAVSPGGWLEAEALWARWGDEPAESVEIALIGPDGRRSLATLPVTSATHPPRHWRERELGRGRYRVRVPADTPAGRHEIVAAVAGRDVSIGWIRVPDEERLFQAPDMDRVREVEFGPVRLLGYDVDASNARPGGELTLRLYWRAAAAVDREAKVFAHLYDASGRLVAQHDAVPGNGTRPLVGWLPGEVVEDAHRIDLPSDLAVGDPLTLAVGIYDPGTGERWTFREGGRQDPSGALRLENVPVLPWGPPSGSYNERMKTIRSATSRSSRLKPGIVVPGRP